VLVTPSSPTFAPDGVSRFTLLASRPTKDGLSRAKVKKGRGAPRPLTPTALCFNPNVKVKGTLDERRSRSTTRNPLARMMFFVEFVMLFRMKEKPIRAFVAQPQVS